MIPPSDETLEIHFNVDNESLSGLPDPKKSVRLMGPSRLVPRPAPDSLSALPRRELFPWPKKTSFSCR